MTHVHEYNTLRSLIGQEMSYTPTLYYTRTLKVEVIMS